MTDKEIIIDDVDVSKCNYFNNTDKSYCEECCSEFGCAICNDRPNCYYKQLKRKEQECEEKQKTAQDAISKLCAEKSALYNELDKLKRDNDLFRTCHDNEQEKRRKYEQTLIEIKEIAENMNNECFYNDFSCDGCDMINGCTYFNKSKILQIIKEMK